jgi:hypothetical protein
MKIGRRERRQGEREVKERRGEKRRNSHFSKQINQN